MKIIHKYLDSVIEEIEKLKQEESVTLEEASQVISESLKKDGTLYAFGTGHSHLIAEELYARAGGLALVKAILPPELMLHEFPTKSTFIERLEGYSENLLELYPVTSNDVMLIISNSGRNSVIVEMALAAKKKGMKVIALTSVNHSSSVESRHSSKKRLMDLADVVLDTLTPKGDAGFYVEGVDTPVGPMSDLMGITIVQTLMVRVVELLHEADVTIPIFKSSNLDGADEYNQALFKKYFR